MNEKQFLNIICKHLLKYKKYKWRPIYEVKKCIRYCLNRINNESFNNYKYNGNVNYKDFLYDGKKIFVKNRTLLTGTDVLGRARKKLYSPKPDLAFAPFNLKPETAEIAPAIYDCVEKKCRIAKKFINNLKKSCKNNAKQYREELKEFKDLISIWIVDHSLRSLDPVEVIGEAEPITSNPRSFIVVEVCFSGSIKHTLGSLVNASLLGYYGIVVTNAQMLERVLRLKYYLMSITTLKKINSMVGRNVLIVTDVQFLTAVKQNFT